MVIKLKNNGQSSVEFLFSFIVAFGFIIFFIKLATLYTNGYLVHYATYMSARNYMVHDKNEGEANAGDSRAVNGAKEVFKSFKLDKFIPGFSNRLEFNHPGGAGDYDRNLLVGVFTEYKAYLPYPIMMAGKMEVNLRSDAFLGREPNRGECVKRICEILKNNHGAGDQCRVYSTLADNGC